MQSIGSPAAEISRLLTRARKFSPENPYYMLHSIIEKLGMQKNGLAEIDEYASSLREIINKCQEHIEIGIETVDAFIAIAVSNWLLGDENEGITESD